MPVKKTKTKIKKFVIKKKRPILNKKNKGKKLAKPFVKKRTRKLLRKRKSSKRAFGWEWMVLIIVGFLIIVVAGYLVVAYFDKCWPFKKDRELEKRAVIQKEVPVDSAKVNWNELEVISDRQISDTNGENKKLVSSSWASDSSRLVFLDEDKSLEESFGGHPWKGKLYNIEEDNRKDLANFFYWMSGNDLKWIGQSSIAIFNNERRLIEADYNGDNLMVIDLDGAISYDLSSDGRKLVLIKEDGEMIIKNLQSGDEKSLGKEKLGDNAVFINPRWSNSGKDIALLKRIDSREVYEQYQNYEIGYISVNALNLNEFKKVGITYIPDIEGVVVDVEWSKNDKFLLDKVSNNVYSIDPAKTLIFNGEEAWQRMESKFSPASDKILAREFFQEEDSNRTFVYVMNLDGSKRIELLQKEGKLGEAGWLADINGAWSSDGEKIIYQSERSLWMVGADGTDLRKLSKDEKAYKELQWSNDGEKIIYRDGNEIRLIKLGTEEIKEKESGDVLIKSDEKLVESEEEEYLEGSTFSSDNKNILYERFVREAEGLGEPPIYYYVVDLESKESKKISDEIYSLSGSYKARWLDNDLIVYDDLTSSGLKIYWVKKDSEIDETMEIDEWNQNWFAWDISNDGKEIVAIDSNNRIYLHKKGRVDGKIIYEGDPSKTVTWIRWSPNKEYIVLLKGEKDVWLLRLEDDHVVENKRLGENIVYGRDGGFDPETSVLWSPDSKKVIAQDSGNVFDVDLGLTAQELLPYFSVKYDLTPVDFDYKWSSNSEWIGYRQDGDLYIVKPDGSDKKLLAEGDISCFAWDSDSGRIFFADDKGMSVINVDGGERRGLIEREGKYSYIKVSSDGKKLVYVRDGDVYLVNVE